MTLRIYKQYDSRFFNVEVWDNGYMLDYDTGLISRSSAKSRGNEMIENIKEQPLLIGQ